MFVPVKRVLVWECGMKLFEVCLSQEVVLTSPMKASLSERPNHSKESKRVMRIELLRIVLFNGEYMRKTETHNHSFFHSPSSICMILIPIRFSIYLSMNFLFSSSPI